MVENREWTWEYKQAQKATINCETHTPPSHLPTHVRSTPYSYDRSLVFRGICLQSRKHKRTPPPLKPNGHDATRLGAAHLPSCIPACMRYVVAQYAKSPLETYISSFSTLESEVNNSTAQRGAGPLSTVKYTLNTGQRA
ncbi:hypothetical protein PAAG_06640 [Paracoccidioides lutzii Pb01]|uniref:Uncharacterized protein n=1 Tax=Paracoccidioides lutzii (strain ATCC MYA-826 / Pb01) TaxID=502779 RepID=C1H799_PARBA|nr:hypothetical protein PAAG_06640 [Paracoccidioides lutzii Pb01]EEH35593.2 hypothetical protein PAAG_06640 [Paracoccidioides lutzii Pb01]